MTATTESTRPLHAKVTAEEWVRRACTLVVAGVAAYASYQHQRSYAREGGSDSVGAVLWPLSVDGLLVLATVGVLTSSQQTSRRYRIAVRVSFWAGIAMSLTANISAAPELTLQPILVAGWPPVALLLAVELLAHSPRTRQHTETELATTETGRAAVETVEAGPETGTATPVGVRVSETDTESVDESDGETAQVITLAGVSPHDGAAGEPTAQEIMWAHFQREQARGRTPTGAELDRVAGTNNYGRTVLRQWRNEGRIPPADQDQRVRGGVG
ncbi:DUF2637 domain-containing protein [Actinophytocola sp.]|uniref:DUF2637 domain-containing protein n=1 Tax=Actinophytocola sp. TaxID=1872138 RepID=UPI0038998FF0